MTKKAINTRSKVAKKKNIMIDINDQALDGIIQEVLKVHIAVVEQFKTENDPKILNFLVGQVMKTTRGKANASVVMEKIKEFTQK